MSVVTQNKVNQQQAELDKIIPEMTVKLGEYEVAVILEQSEYVANLDDKLEAQITALQNATRDISKKDSVDPEIIEAYELDDGSPHVMAKAMFVLSSGTSDTDIEVGICGDYHADGKCVVFDDDITCSEQLYTNQVNKAREVLEDFIVKYFTDKGLEIL